MAENSWHRYCTKKLYHGHPSTYCDHRLLWCHCTLCI